MIWNYSLEEIERGYTNGGESFCCVICQEEFKKGKIYQLDEQLYDAEGAVNCHIKNCHDSIAMYLLNQNVSVTGLTDIQVKLLRMLLARKSDQQIGHELGIAQSTVRNHRFKLREKEKQAKLFLALMNSIEEETKKPIEESDTGIVEDVHNSAKMVDDRYNITDQDRIKTLATYMDENGALKQFPSKEKKKIIVLREIMKNFKHDVSYTEVEVNQVLRRIFEEDYPVLRRALIEYGFMDRAKDCSSYRVKE